METAHAYAHLYTAPQDHPPKAAGHECRHVYSELDPRPGNLYCPSPTKGVTAKAAHGGLVPTAPPRGHLPALFKPSPRATSAHRSLGLPTQDRLELDDDAYGVSARCGPSRPEPDPWPIHSGPQPVPCRPERDPRLTLSKLEPGQRPVPTRLDRDLKPKLSRSELDRRLVPDRPDPDLKPTSSRPEPYLKSAPGVPARPLRPVPGRSESIPRPLPTRPEP
ncbi:hypothetical protein chiPu_0022916, partial [Chiloscyllium punctatum]|nr:hypothetical protein [Chiloscyllium punctatum]